MGIEERLICAVENNPIIYDKTLSEYKSNNARENAWKNVGKELKIEDIDNLRKRWRTLRDAFIKHYRIAKTFKTGTAGGKKKKWVYYDLMLFLVPYIEFRETVHSYEDGSNSLLDQSQMDNTQMEESQSEIQDSEREGDEAPENDAVVESQHSMTNSVRPAKSTLQQHQGSVVINNKKQQQPCFKNKKNNNNLTDEKLLEIVTKNDDPDEQFLLSCLPALKRLTPRNNMLARIKIQQLLFNIEYGHVDEERSTANSGNTRSSTRSSFFNSQSPYTLSAPESPEAVISGIHNTGGNFNYLNHTPSTISSVLQKSSSTDDMGNIYSGY